MAIVGPTGAGKTTLVNLLMRFYELNSGEIRIDGKNIADLTRENVHDLFCMVLQDTWLFEGTIRENIVYSKQGVSDAEVQAACEAVGLDHFIRQLPQGYDTPLNDRANLSAGQKQLVTIARAMIENAPQHHSQRRPDSGPPGRRRGGKRQPPGAFGQGRLLC